MLISCGLCQYFLSCGLLNVMDQLFQGLYRPHGLVALTAFSFNQLPDCSRPRGFLDLPQPILNSCSVTQCLLGTWPCGIKTTFPSLPCSYLWPCVQVLANGMSVAGQHGGTWGSILRASQQASALSLSLSPFSGTVVCSCHLGS